MIPMAASRCRRATVPMAASGPPCRNSTRAFEPHGLVSTRQERRSPHAAGSEAIMTARSVQTNDDAVVAMMATVVAVMSRVAVMAATFVKALAMMTALVARAIVTAVMAALIM